MNQVVDKHITKVIIDVMIFLEFSDEDIVNFDSSLQVIENIAAELKLMDHNLKESFTQTVIELSEYYDSEMKDFVKNLPNLLGV